jgi:catecholate siderophore receptor
MNLPRPSSPSTHIHRLAGAICLALFSPLLLAADAAPESVEAPDGAAKFKRRSASQLDQIQVEAEATRADFPALDTSSATRTDTTLRDIPQAISVVTQDLIREQAIGGMNDVVRYVPGMGMAQGEGNRDTPIFRGNASTADLFVDGVRDDVQYYRDVYNIERVEVLKGPNAMIFGYGGAGGVLNRVTKQADWRRVREANLQFGAHSRWRGSFDLGDEVSETMALRLTGLFEDSDSYRDDVGVQRYGVNPTVSVLLGEHTSATLGVEHFSDRRTADRGVPSFQGRPLATDPSTFFGDPEASYSDATVDAFTALIEHEFSDSIALRNRSRWADYDKFYQNVFPGAVSADGRSVSLSAYNNATQRSNVFNQTDLIFNLSSGAWEHTLLVGAEIGRQETDNLRLTGFFPAAAAGGAERTSINVPVSDPNVRLPLSFYRNRTEQENRGDIDIAALYVQDQIVFNPRWQAVLGLRYDRFDADFLNVRANNTRVETSDDLISPRAGLIFRPIEPLSIYASYGIAYLPRAGEQLASLTPANAAFDPEEFENLELGAKWDLDAALTLSAALYRLERSNVAVPDPDDAARTILVDGQRSEGFELELAGEITERWRVVGGYTWADSEITRTQSSTIVAGNAVAQLPEHSFALWNRIDLNPSWGVALGATRRSDSFATADNRVVLPGYTRLDAAAYYRASEQLQVQLNVENLLNREYHASAHNNNNLLPGSPVAAYLSMNLRF